MDSNHHHQSQRLLKGKNFMRSTRFWIASYKGNEKSFSSWYDGNDIMRVTIAGSMRTTWWELVTMPLQSFTVHILMHHKRYQQLSSTLFLGNHENFTDGIAGTSTVGGG